MVGGEQDEMEVRLDLGTNPASLSPVPRSDVRLHPDDRLETGLAGLILELPGRVEVAMVGDRERGLFELQGPGDQVVDTVRPVQQGVLAVAVQMDEAHRQRN